MNKIKAGWLELYHRKTEKEFRVKAIDRINSSIEDIKFKVSMLSNTHNIFKDDLKMIEKKTQCKELKDAVVTLRKLSGDELQQAIYEAE